MAEKTRINFSKTDKEYLCALIKPHADIIKSKDKDNETLKKKKNVWQQIVIDFNANFESSSSRTEEQLKSLWNNLCNRAKEETAKAKQSKRKTGGGPPLEDVTVLSQNVADIIDDQILPLDNPFDGDADHQGEDVIKIRKKETNEEKLCDKYFLPKRKRVSTPTTSTMVGDEIVKMRRDEHEATMEKLKWETAYWRAMYQSKFGENDTENTNDGPFYYHL